MNLYMTRIPGVPDRLNDVKPGMAWYCGTGPRGKTCGDCEFRTYPRRVEVLAASNEPQLACGGWDVLTQPGRRCSTVVACASNNSRVTMAGDRKVLPGLPRIQGEGKTKLETVVNMT